VRVLRYGGLALAKGQATSLSLCLLHRTRGEKKMEELIGQDKYKEITFQLLSQAKQTQIGEN